MKDPPNSLKFKDPPNSVVMKGALKSIDNDFS